LKDVPAGVGQNGLFKEIIPHTQIKFPTRLPPPMPPPAHLVSNSELLMPVSPDVNIGSKS